MAVVSPPEGHSDALQKDFNPARIPSKSSVRALTPLICTVSGLTMTEIVDTIASMIPIGVPVMWPNSMDSNNSPPPHAVPVLATDLRTQFLLEARHKGARDAEKVEEDIKTLVEFTRFTDETPHPYRRAIYLIFGEGAEEVLGKVKAKLNGRSQDAAKIEVWTHCRVGEAASRES